jgi:protein subunit release factor B
VAIAGGRPSLDENRTQLLAEMQAPGFWDDPAKAAVKMRSFRAVDAHANALDALIRNCQYASRRAHEAKSEADVLAAGRLVEEAALGVQLAQARAAGGGGSDADEVVIEICAGGEGAAHASWVSGLARMYLLWAEKRGCEATPVAEADHPVRAILRITGPGVRGYLAGEAGIHRRIEDAKRVTAFVRVHTPPESLPTQVVVDEREVKKRPGTFVDRVNAETTARDDSTGRVVTLSGAEGIDHLSQIAAAVLRASSSEGEARRYQIGRAARVEDPRTGAATPRVKEVLRGELDLFIAAWLSRPPSDKGVVSAS